MARYGDLYTPARDYGQVYRGSLASRQKSVEQAGQNMKDFAGEVYKLVDRHRQVKAEQEEAKSVERERASLQNSRKVRDNLLKEEQEFNRYLQKLRNVVTLFKDEEGRLDAKRYSKYGGSKLTADSYDERYGQLMDRLAMAQQAGPSAIRGVLDEFRDLIPELQGVHAVDILDPKQVSDSSLSGYAPMSKDLYMEKHLDKTVGGNQFRDLLRSLLKHPLGFGDAVDDTDSIVSDFQVTDQERQTTDDLARGDYRRKDVKRKLYYEGQEGKKEVEDRKLVETEISKELTEAEKEGGKKKKIVKPPPPEVDPDINTNIVEEGDDPYGELIRTNPWYVGLTDTKQKAIDLISEISIKMSSKEKEDTPAARTRLFNEFKTLRSKFEQADKATTPEEKQKLYEEGFNAWLSGTKTGQAAAKSKDPYYIESVWRAFELLLSEEEPTRSTRTLSDVETGQGWEQFKEDILPALKEKFNEAKAKYRAGLDKMKR